MTKIGILGGTFDPPHHGHLLMASEVLHSLGLDEIWFMPNNVPPHKQETKVSSSEHRVKMLELAISENDNFKVSTIELERKGPSYTYDTMFLLKKRFPKVSFYFIIGGDMIEHLSNWKNINNLENLVTFVGVSRPGFSISSPYNIITVAVPQFDVSSTMIRNRFNHQQQTRYLLPDSVLSYIEEYKLYE
ncbi:nicotinate-nucleotide adenylyltransferase [Bacillus carboniphilus]|uniref:Probable nicotinate-nucleotide adenylyltransferase n=1 Tax=Bacillus carboniphilus TaxID=86663 RepID=A0ABY9K096_9BACI|nr:nicotinate-nucleotide adenylyltransferase [Bacillus carboniphilus]WLR44013.1 nicotinate-nucleotide adenylyltransferase [Bacillus carboniphilus]